MRELKVFRLKNEAIVLLGFEWEGGGFCIRVLDNDLTMRDVTDMMFKTPELAARAMKRTVPGCGEVSMGSRIILSPPSVERNDVGFKNWKKKIFSVFERRSQVMTEPTVVDSSVIHRCRTVSGQFQFTMTLPNYQDDGQGERVPVSFNLTAFTKFDANIGYDTRHSIPPAHQNVSVIPSIPDKFNYLSYEDGKITFCDRKDFLVTNYDLPRQSTKPSKVIPHLFSIGEAHISLNGRDILGTYALSTLEHRDDGKLLKDTACTTDLSIKWMQYYILKGRERLWEIINSEFKPKDYDLKVTTNINKIYGTPNAEKGNGTLGGSCMAAHNVSSYNCAQNPDFYNQLKGVKIIYALDDKGGLYGRALVWKGKGLNPETKKMQDMTFIDRIYGSEDFITAVRQWGAEKGYWWRLDQSAGSITLTNKDSVKIDVFESEVSKLSFGDVNRRVPYFDTLKYFTVISKSKNYASLKMTSQAYNDSQKTSGTDAAIIIVKCEHCGIILVKNKRVSAWKDASQTVEACVHCAVTFGGKAFIKSDGDVRLTFSSSGHKVMPKLMQPTRLVTINIDGKEVRFDSDDSQGIKNFFKQRAMKGENFDQLQHKRIYGNSLSSPW